jgi:hypothetical protein
MWRFFANVTDFEEVWRIALPRIIMIEATLSEKSVHGPLITAQLGLVPFTPPLGLSAEAHQG